LDNTKKQEPATEIVEVDQAVVMQQKLQAAKIAAKFAQQQNPEVEPMTAEEMKALIAQAKSASGDDCLMCGS
jgi:ribonucleoside-diphosphate reductase alpha chain